MTNYLKQPAFLIRAALVNLGLGVMPPAAPGDSWPMYTNKEPAKPDEVVTIYNTTGKFDGRSMIDGLRFEHPGVQVRVRSLDGPRGEEKSGEILQAFDLDLIAYTFTLDGVTYTIDNVTRTSGAVPLGSPPGSSLSLFTINAIVAASRQ